MTEWILLLKSVPQQQEELIPYLQGDKDLVRFILEDYPKLPDELARSLERNLTTRKGSRFLDLLQNNNDPLVRRWSLALAGLLPAELQIPRLFAALGDKDEENKLVAAQALGKLQSQEVVDTLIKGLTMEKWLPARIVQALLTIGPLALPKVINLTRSADSKLKLYAIEILEQYRYPEAGRAIANLLVDQSPTVRKKAAAALAYFPELVDTLINTLVHEQDISVKVHLIRAIGKLNVAGARQLLQTEANDKDPQIAQAARTALQSINTNGGVIHYSAESTGLPNKGVSQS